MRSASLPLFLPIYLCANVGPRGLLAAAWPAPSAPQSATSLGPPATALRKSSPPWLPVPAPPTGLGECFCFISLAVGLPYSSIFCEFGLFFVFKLFLSFFWLCEEAQCPKGSSGVLQWRAPQDKPTIEPLAPHPLLHQLVLVPPFSCASEPGILLPQGLDIQMHEDG